MSSTASIAEKTERDVQGVRLHSRSWLDVSRSRRRRGNPRARRSTRGRARGESSPARTSGGGARPAASRRAYLGLRVGCDGRHAWPAGHRVMIGRRRLPSPSRGSLARGWRLLLARGPGARPVRPAHPRRIRIVERRSRSGVAAGSLESRSWLPGAFASVLQLLLPFRLAPECSLQSLGNSMYLCTTLTSMTQALFLLVGRFWPRASAIAREAPPTEPIRPPSSGRTSVPSGAVPTVCARSISRFRRSFRCRPTTRRPPRPATPR